MATINEIKLYRITHIENIPHILQNGITHRKSPRANPNYISIGDKSLISTRENKKLWVTNVEEKNLKLITLGDFIPFHFGTKMPMLYKIQRENIFICQVFEA